MEHGKNVVFTKIHAHLRRLRLPYFSSPVGEKPTVFSIGLDNTLWGGVIGDDGVGGILIGNGGATAEAHLNIQKWH